MRTRRAHRVLTTWLALLAMLMAALAPSVSQALDKDTGASWAEICSSSGARWVQSGGSEPAPARDTGPMHLFEHCPYCSLHAGDLALPPAASTPPLLSGLSHRLPGAFLAAPRTLFAWSSAQARAPPAAG